MKKVKIINNTELNQKYNEAMIERAMRYAFKSITLPISEVGEDVYQELITDKVLEHLRGQYEEQVNL